MLRLPIRRLPSVDLRLNLWHNLAIRSTKAVMETSKPDVRLAANPGVVRAGADQQAENPSGAASRTEISRCAGPASRYEWQVNSDQLSAISLQQVDSRTLYCSLNRGAQTIGNQGGIAGA